MTERQAASSKPRLARKGLAVPAGPASQPGLVEPNGASSARPGAGPGAEMDREASTGTSAPLPAREAAPIPNPEAAPAREAETAPTASLLPFDFLGARGPSFDPARLPRAEPEVTLDPSAGPLAAPPPVAAARVDPSWRMGHDPKPARPGRGHARPALAAALAVAVVLGLGWHAHRAGWLNFEARTTARVEAPNEIAAQGAPTRETPGQEAPGATPAVAEKMVPEKIVPEKTDGTAATSAPASALAPAGAPAPVPAAAPALAPATAPSDEGDEAGQVPEAVPPSIDVVRVESDGAAVIAGRAAPGAELIVLDNGAPIGTATADAFGEWVLIPDAPLPAGAHEFGLVVKRVQGGVTLPAAGEAGETGEAGEQSPAGGAPAREEAERGHDAQATGSAREPVAHAPVPARKPAVAGAAAQGYGGGVPPVPARKPAVAGAAAQGNGGGVPPGASSADVPGADFPGADFPGADFVVQLASVKTRAGAEREWRVLRQRFPKLLGDMRLSLGEAKLAGGVIVVRLRTGAFADARDAAALCKRLVAKRQDCLVVRAATGG